MKPFILLLSLVSASALFAADTDRRPPLEIIKHDGYLALFDNSSYFVFSQDGTFSSFPVGLCGRELRGTWTSDGQGQFTAIAKFSWLNGVSGIDDYRRVVFAIYDGSTEPLSHERAGFVLPDSPPDSQHGVPPKIEATAITVKKVYRGYFIIEELTTIPKPR